MCMNDEYFCYITSNKNRTVLYIGYTKDLKNRLIMHKNKRGSRFTSKYNAEELIYFEVFDNKKDAKAREGQLKNWHKKWEWNLIKNSNPELKTLEIN